jgi:hypothetical protein
VFCPSGDKVWVWLWLHYHLELYDMILNLTFISYFVDWLSLWARMFCQYVSALGLKLMYLVLDRLC